MRQILPGLYNFTGLLMGRVYLIEDPDGLTLVDAGIAQTGAKILSQIQAMGRSPKDVKRILITHAHADHVGALPLLKRETGAKVICSAIEQPVVEGKARVVPPPPEAVSGLAALMRPKQGMIFEPVSVERALQDGDTLPEVMGGLTALMMPGHSPGHMAFWQPGQRLIFCGDVIMRLPYLRPPFAPFTTDLAEAKRSIRRLVDLEPAIVCFGHGNPLWENTVLQLQTFARKIGV
jgi:glyoxylase-like metal-dependent hydrolase (beta-lactamase superfamily II)